MTNQYYNAAADAVPGTTVRSAQFNDNNDSLEQGFDILPTPNILYSLGQNFGTATNINNNVNMLEASIAPNRITAFADGISVVIRAPATNTGPAQFNLNGLGLKQVRTPSGTPVDPNDIVAGALIQLRYNLTTDYWQVEAALTAVARAQAAANQADAAVARAEALEPQINQNTADIAALSAIVGQDSINVDRILAPICSLFGKSALIERMSGELRFTRRTGATLRTRYGTEQSVIQDQPRQEANGWLFEGERRNFFTNPETPAAQSVVLPSGTYTLWIEGTGRAQTARGNATSSAPLTFTTAGETLNVTIFGSVTRWQLEQGSNPSSFIPGSLGTRAAEELLVDVFDNIPRFSQPWTQTILVQNPVNNFCIMEASGFLLQVNSSGVVTVNGIAVATAADFSNQTSVTITSNGSLIIAYIGGTEQTNVAVTVNDISSGRIRFGARLDGSLPMSGYLSNYKSYDYQLSSDDVSFLYT